LRKASHREAGFDKAANHFGLGYAKHQQNMHETHNFALGYAKHQNNLKDTNNFGLGFANTCENHSFFR
jgi:hypothetical protein